jgi:hypothetical protein
MIPARGEPMALVHNSELRQFDHLPGKKLTYLGFRDYEKQLRVLLKGAKSIAVEYSVKAAVPNVSRVDAGTLELIRATGITVRSSDTLVQYTKAIWGDPGRTAHYIAVHHVVELRKEALQFVTKKLIAREPVSEYDVQQRLVHGMVMRGLVGPPPVVAAGVNTADPYYVPTAARTAQIQPGDLLVISLAAKVDKPEGIYAAQTWCAVADKTVPDKIANAFQTVSLARDNAVVLITDRMKKRRPVTGAEVDQRSSRRPGSSIRSCTAPATRSTTICKAAAPTSTTSRSKIRASSRRAPASPSGRACTSRSSSACAPRSRSTWRRPGPRSRRSRKTTSKRCSSSDVARHRAVRHPDRRRGRDDGGCISPRDAARVSMPALRARVSPQAVAAVPRAVPRVRRGRLESRCVMSPR